MRIHHLFISHSWTYGNQYGNLVRLLRTRSYFDKVVGWNTESVVKAIRELA